MSGLKVKIRLRPVEKEPVASDVILDSAAEVVRAGKKRTASSDIKTNVALKVYLETPNEDTAVNYDAWEKSLSSSDVTQIIKKNEQSARPHPALIKPEAMVSLWNEAVQIQHAKEERASKLEEVQKRMQERHLEDRKSLKQIARQQDEQKKKEEEMAKDLEERKRAEEREKARQERALLSQTVDLDAQQDIMDNDDDMGGF